MQLGAMDCVEVNEAFGAQCLAVAKELGTRSGQAQRQRRGDRRRPSLGRDGHAAVADAARQLAATGGKHGIASACIGGGQGTALLLAPM